MVSVLKESAFEIKPLNPAIGAQINGVDMAQPLSADQVAVISAALVEHKVVFFREQNISQAQHIAFAANFGALEVHPFTKNLPDHPEIIRLHNDESTPPGATALWHSDVTWRQEPSLGSILLCRTCPPNGGDTLFANMELAYENLDDKTREEIDDLVAIHDFAGFREGMFKRGASEEEIAAFNQKYPIAKHPVVRTHPVSGRKSIYVNRAFTIGIEGMADTEAQALLNRLYLAAWRPDVQCRFIWQQGSVAFWDNRAAQHYAVADYFPHTRTMERVTIVGEKPYR